MTHSPVCCTCWSSVQTAYDFPSADFCNVEMRENSLLLPISMNGPKFLGDKSHSRAGPGDKRERKACFLGSPTGWTNGRR